MAVISVPTEDECYLWAILTDQSGLDLAEFSWYDPTNEDGCFRAWPYQWAWWRTMDPLQIDQSARSIGKSLSIKVRGFAFPFNFPGQEMVITAPEKVHLEPITDLIEQQLLATRLSRELLPKKQNHGITHNPLKINFVNGARIMGRIPQRDGKGIKGIHPIWLELDEGQDYPAKGWTELVETLKRGMEGAVWRVHGVTRGVRDHFFKFTQPESGWTVHRYTAMARPNWSAQEREEKIEMYNGSEDDPDYRRNVLGLHGDATSPIFVLTRLMACVDDDQSSEYNSLEYQFLRISNEMLATMNLEMAQALTLPEAHKEYKTTWVGMDVGFTRDPSEILVFAEETQKGKPSRLKLLTRLQMVRVGIEDQVEAVLKILDFYRPKTFAMDATGVGQPLYQLIQSRVDSNPNLRSMLQTIRGYNFKSKILVDFDKAKENPDIELPMEELIKEAGVERQVLEYATDKLREYVDTKRLLLPWDRDLIGEYQGGTVEVITSGVDAYGRRRFSGGKDHALDASRMAILGHAQYAIEELTRSSRESTDPVYVFFIDPDDFA